MSVLRKQESFPTTDAARESRVPVQPAATDRIDDTNMDPGHAARRNPSQLR